MIDANRGQASNLDLAQANARAVTAYLAAEGLTSEQVGYLLVCMSFTQAADQLRATFDDMTRKGLPPLAALVRADMLEGLSSDLALLCEVDSNRDSDPRA